MTTTTIQFIDAWKKAKSGVCLLEPEAMYDMGATSLPAIRGSGIFIGVDQKYIDQPWPTLLFHPSQGSKVTQALHLGGDVTISHLLFKATGAGQLLLAESGCVRVDHVTIQSGAGLATMRGADLLDVSDIDGVAAANMIYSGGSCGFLRMRNCNLRGGVLNEHGLRTHGLDELDWDGGFFDGSGSVWGKDVLTIHELRKRGTIANVHFKGWATIGGLKSEPTGDNTKAQVNNLTLRNVTFEPCIRASGQCNGSQAYFLAGVNNFVWDGGSIIASNGSCIRWSNDGASKDRKSPTGTVRNVTGCGSSKDKFVNGVGGLKYKGLGNTMNGKAL